MTAINVFPSPDRVLLFTDGICYADDGTIVGLVTKVLTVPHLPAAIAIRGRSTALFTLGAALAARWQSFDALVAGIGPELRAADNCGMAEIVIAGWSQARAAAEAYFIRTYEFEIPEGCEAVGPTPPAFTLFKIETVTPTPYPNGWQAADIGPEEGIKLMEQQRDSNYGGSISSGGMQIGGFVQVTMVTRDDIHQRVIHRWPEDKPGCKVGEQPHWHGGLGRYALQAADFGLRKAGVVPDPPKPEDTLADIPFVRAFVVRYPSASARSIQDFYDAFNRAERYYQTFQGRMKEGDLEGARQLSDVSATQYYQGLIPFKETLTQQARLVRLISKMPDKEIPPAEKRQLIDGAYYEMIRIAKSGVEVVRAFENKVSSNPHYQRLKAAGFTDQEISDWKP